MTPVVPDRLLGAALGYAQRRWPVFPLHSTTVQGDCTCGNSGCENPGKHPRTSHGFKDASTDEGQIRTWWKRWPDANIGIATGSASGIVVLDIDNKHDGVTKLHEIEAQHGDLPVTITVRTGNGYHLYFRHPGTHVKSLAALAGNVGLDVRGDGGYVVAPPSRHASGNEYVQEHEPADGQLAAMPDWLKKLVSDPAPATVVPASSESPIRIPEGQRNDVLFRLASSMRSRGASETAIIAALKTENAERCDPPLTEQEIAAIVLSAGRYPNSANNANSANQGNAVDHWDPPTPFHEFELPPFPIDALPGPLRAFVEAEAVATQTPPDLAGMLTLSVCAAVCAKKVVVQADEGWTEPTNIFTATMQKPGTRKSAVFTAVLAPLEQFEADEIRRMAPEVDAAQTRYNVAKAALDQAERAAAKASGDEQEPLMAEAQELARHLGEIKVPALPRYLADDSTPESLSKLLYEQDGRLAVMSPEGGVFDIMAGRYSQNASPNFEVYLKAHAGDAIRVDRVSRGAEHVEAPALTVGLAIQPQVLQGIVEKAAFRGRGLFARFLYSMPLDLVGRRKSRQPSVPHDIRRQYDDLVRRLLELPWNVDDDGEHIPHVIHLDPGARDRLQAFEDWLEPQLGDGGDLAGIADWASKLAGAVVRVGGILHMVENIDRPDPWRAPIDPVTIERAIGIARYLIPHSKAAHALMGADPVVEEAKRLLRWLARSGKIDFTKRDVFEGTKGHFKKVAEMEPALALLADHGYIRERPLAERAGPGRRPAPIYDVNPHLHSQNSHNSHKSLDEGNSANCANPPPPKGPVPPTTEAIDAIDGESMRLGAFE